MVPLIAIHSAGFYSYFNIRLPGNLPIVDTHPSPEVTDLRLLNPWPELANFARELTHDIESLDAYAHGHIPYTALLLYYIEFWKASHDGKPPISYADKVMFRKMVAAGARTDTAEGGEENYDEAVAAVLKNLNLPALTSGLKEVFDHEPSLVRSQSKYAKLMATDECQKQTESQDSFWVITGALKRLYEKHGVLPLPGSIPDQKTDSKTFVDLQSIYRSKARTDAAEVLATVRSLPHGTSVPAEEVELYCKNAAHVKLIHRRESSQTRLKELARKYSRKLLYCFTEKSQSKN
jgi:amyloid beta precursor protein binding protein 1